ncbi:MAG: type II toxin-antitoxin system RelE/ParE family toxin [Devosia nanyangense]|uniref:Type II toxin-antitoxin system RelE/ParE family toxin n=1 Tax=Devosia nanyangense TaxID=1228055 RepID=A0A933NY63_9HYPH|nr:type II toxin-antitoxin system RelE/ParE family toxin [Devosia nanyangense]
MSDWGLIFHPDFGVEFHGLPDEAKVALGVVFDLLREFGPALGRPQIDTLKGSRHANMKEMRVQTGGDWYRLAFAFDPTRNAVVLCGGAKGGISQSRFYARLVSMADERYDERLAELEE